MGVLWIQPFFAKDLTVAWRRRMTKSWVCGVWKMIPSAIWLCIGKKKNRRIFYGQSFILARFRALLLENLT